jgi:hypothetical protein
MEYIKFEPIHISYICAQMMAYYRYIVNWLRRNKRYYILFYSILHFTTSSLNIYLCMGGHKNFKIILVEHAKKGKNADTLILCVRIEYCRKVLLCRLLNYIQ